MASNWHTDLPLSIRALIVGYRLHFGCGWVEISSKLGCRPDTAQKFYERTYELAGTPDLAELLLHIESKPRPHPEPFLEPGSIDSHETRESTLRHKTWERVHAVNHDRKLEGKEPLKEQVVRNACLQKRHYELDPDRPKPIKRRRRLRKTLLDDDNKRERLDYTNTLENLAGYTVDEGNKARLEGKQLDTNLVIIGVDEYAVGFGGAGNELISAMPGEDTYKDAQNVPPVRFKLMQWGAACSEPCNVKRRQIVWEKESDTLTTDLADQLKEANARAYNKVEEQLKNAEIPHTIEWNHMQRVNRAINEHNSTIPKGVRKGRKQRRTPTKEFKHVEFERDHEKGGLDYVWYAFKVYKDLLIPYYKEVQKAFPNKRVVISEDSATPHVRARKLYAPELEEAGVEFIDWPANSPDLHPVEDLQRHHKLLLEDLRFEVSSATNNVKQHCKDEMERTWIEDPIFDKIAIDVMSVSNYMRLAGLCRLHGGGNNFNA
jgi:hypothetical protein